MRIADALRQADQRLRSAGIEDSRLEAQLLLCYALGVDRTRLLAALDEAASEEQSNRFEMALKRRLRREPTSYIIGHREFYDIELEVTPVAPVPRPETELVVEETLRFAKNFANSLTVVDVGTGSGAIALAVAKHLPRARVLATDIATDVLTLAKRNAERLGLADRIEYVQTDLIAGLEGPFDIVVANLPYVKSGDWEGLAPEIRLYEPLRAFDGGDDGLQLIQRLLAQTAGVLSPGCLMILEISWDQARALRSLVEELLPQSHLSVKQDLAGLDRIAIIKSS